MGVKYFSKKEAISHGFRMTKKYFKFVFGLILIYAVFHIASTALNAFSGIAGINRYQLSRVYKDPGQQERLYKSLVEAGYIDKHGMVQAKLRFLKQPSELVLAPDMEADRDRIFHFLTPYRYRLPFPRPVYFLLSIAFAIVGLVMQIGLIKIGLSLSRDRKTSFAELFLQWRLFFKYLFASICYVLAFIGGLILLIVPGIIFAIALQMYPYLVVDKGLGPLASLKASRGLTRGARWQLFVFWALLGLVNIAGFLCLVVGLVFTIPATMIASAYVYDQLRKRKESPPAPAAPAV
ncbi:MAG: hypothetical protein ACM3OC_01785 [Deltaproteobacteria bacterium]